MIHVTPILLLAAGAGLANVPFGKLTQRAKLLTTARQALVVTAPKETELAEVGEPSAAVDGGRSPYLFATTTGVTGLSIVAQFAVPILVPVSLIAIGYLAGQIYKEASISIFKDKQLKVDILDATVITLCVGFGQVAAAGFMVWVLDIADLLLEKTRHRSKKYITDIFGLHRQKAWLLVDGQEIEVEISKLQKGDVIVVNTGEQVPVDGTIVHGMAMVDQHSLTGEAAPVEKQNGDEAFATTVLVAGKLHIEVLKTGQETVAAQILAIINDAAEFKVDLQSKGEKIADRMVLPTLGLGTLGFFTAGSGGMLAIINADYGTGIRVSAPIALLGILGRAAKHGVLIKDSRVFELLHDIDVVLFDKTGTLTHDIPTVVAIVSADAARYSPDTLLRYTATAEQKFSHPIAKAILRQAEDAHLSLMPHDESKYYVGYGIEVVIEHRHIKVGSARYMEQETIALTTEIAAALDASRARGNSAILIAIDQQIAGLIELQAQVRPEAVQVMQHLHAQGIKEIVLISGDHDAPTRELAKQLCIDRYFAGVLPHEKADYVRLLQAEGKKVMMVGDGINDSAALSLADIGVSLQGASTLAIDVADIVFMDGNLEKFDYLFQATQVLHKNIDRSFKLILFPNSVCILGGLTGVFGLASSLVLNNGFNLISAINGIYIHKEVDALEQPAQIKTSTALRPVRFPSRRRGLTRWRPLPFRARPLATALIHKRH